MYETFVYAVINHLEPIQIGVTSYLIAFLVFEVLDTAVIISWCKFPPLVCIHMSWLALFVAHFPVHFSAKRLFSPAVRRLHSQLCLIRTLLGSQEFWRYEKLESHKCELRRFFTRRCSRDLKIVRISESSNELSSNKTELTLLLDIVVLNNDWNFCMEIERYYLWMCLRWKNWYHHSSLSFDLNR